PIAPFVKIWQGVASKQPDETVLRIAPLQPPDRVDGEAGALANLEIADPDPRPARHVLGRGQARLERRHVGRALLQRIAGRDQPPDLVEAERAHRLEADVPMPAMRRVERAAEETDAGHGCQLACARMPAYSGARRGRNGRQFRSNRRCDYRWRARPSRRAEGGRSRGRAHARGALPQLRSGVERALLPRMRPAGACPPDADGLLPRPRPRRVPP